MPKFDPEDLVMATKPAVALELQPKSISIIKRALVSWAEHYSGNGEENEAARMLARSIFSGYFTIEVRSIGG